MAKYEILFKQLRMAILRGEYAPNDRLPSENAIAIKHGVSRITSKRALNELAAADLVYPRSRWRDLRQTTQKHHSAPNFTRTTFS
ncbi:winged helix-turn-helix domain-containing protein [Lactiplantibacillus pentosus]|uniref:winged helix-turn-helix domain-containing protein n=1 Tax=Lactiplantibacillus pentosus TaxID=1589 RepID=UPI0020A71A0E|nr:winged helix-turn-helix domain-containing protein [Lactiplantibacillus pentosus]MDY1543625.1 winged helix-turn-helix domain-containing protein [Lactiplantibacillus pentosus]